MLILYFKKIHSKIRFNILLLSVLPPFQPFQIISKINQAKFPKLSDKFSRLYNFLPPGHTVYLPTNEINCPALRQQY